MFGFGRKNTAEGQTLLQEANGEDAYKDLARVRAAAAAGESAVRASKERFAEDHPVATKEDAQAGFPVPPSEEVTAFALEQGKPAYIEPIEPTQE